MFERRLKIFLGILLGFMAVLLLRAVHLQVFTRGQWLKEAEEFNKKAVYTETTRGRILDHVGREIAVDEACMDACVDYRAISRSDKWIAEVAAARLTDRLGEQYSKAKKAQREQMVAAEAVTVNADIDAMWDLLARESNFGQTLTDAREHIDEICHTIDLKVAIRTRWLQYKHFQQANAKNAQKGPGPWYRRWVLEGGAGGPKVDDYEQESGEQVDVHAILKNISSDVYMRLAKAADHCPGLELRPGTHRRYPFGRAAAHLLGQLAPVTKGDLDSDPNFDADTTQKELRKYEPTDLIGRGGLEGLCEPILRGSRGKLLRQIGKEDEPLDAPLAGQDVRSTIDIALQGEIQDMFAHLMIPDNRYKSDDESKYIPCPMHGAAVVIDVKSGDVRALASYPDYDPNTLNENYETLVSDKDNAPLMNRATQSQLEPGSTIKPAVGLGAITLRCITEKDGIECNGFLTINGKKYPNGRCWVATRYLAALGPEGVRHHQIPFPHRGRYGNPDGFLCYADALERSCNVFFETCADKMGMDKLSDWLDHMGLGHETGIGIPESRGSIPRDLLKGAGGGVYLQRSVVWFSGIGQSGVVATPIQMANIAATIARDGIWMKPKLIEGSDPDRLAPVPLHNGRVLPDKMDLGISKEALAAAREGMRNVVNADAGTGTTAHMDNLLVAGKTGTAQASKIPDLPQMINGKIVMVPRPLATADHPTDTPWYRGWGEKGDQRNHAWFIGFAPADKPQVAFAVMIQYGGTGGFAGKVATKILQKCIDHGYVTPTAKPQ